VSYRLLDPALIFTEPDTDGMILLKCILKKEAESVVWTQVAWVREQWQALVKNVLNLHVSYNVGNFLTM